jgi:hypothetical protein
MPSTKGLGPNHRSTLGDARKEIAWPQAAKAWNSLPQQGARGGGNISQKQQIALRPLVHACHLRLADRLQRPKRLHGTHAIDPTVRDGSSPNGYDGPDRRRISLQTCCLRCLQKALLRLLPRVKRERET